MANAFQNTDLVVRDSAIVLQDKLVMGNLASRNLVEGQFATKVGKTITVKTVPDLGAANEFTSTTSATDVTEPTVDIAIEKHFYQRVDLTPDQMNYEVDDFVTSIAAPMAKSLAESIDSYLIDKAAAGFAQTLAGTAGTAPSTVEDIVLARKAILDARGTFDNMVGVVGTTAEASFLQLDSFVNADYGPERPQALRDASLGRLHGVNWFASQNIGTLDQGDTGGTVLLSAAGTAGDTTVSIDGLTEATGTIYAGTRFTIAGTSTVYTVTDDATIASNAATLSIYPALTANEADNDAVTFQTAPTQDMIFNTNAFQAAIIAPMPFNDGGSAVQFMNGMSVRASFFKNVSTLVESFILDTYVGGKVIHPQSGSVFQA